MNLTESWNVVPAQEVQTGMWVFPENAGTDLGVYGTSDAGPEGVSDFYANVALALTVAHEGFQGILNTIGQQAIEGGASVLPGIALAEFHAALPSRWTGLFEGESAEDGVLRVLSLTTDSTKISGVVFCDFEDAGNASINTSALVRMVIGVPQTAEMSREDWSGAITPDHKRALFEQSDPAPVDGGQSYLVSFTSKHMSGTAPEFVLGIGDSTERDAHPILTVAPDRLTDLAQLVQRFGLENAKLEDVAAVVDLIAYIPGMIDDGIVPISILYR